jgi:hypothetical protein
MLMNNEEVTRCLPIDKLKELDRVVNNKILEALSYAKSSLPK